MVYEVVRAADVERDLGLIFDFLFETALRLEEDAESAFQRASARIAEIEADMEALGKPPHQGTLRPQLGATIRNVTKRRAIFYFETDDANQVLRFLAVFFGGQDHETHILLRLLQPQ